MLTRRQFLISSGATSILLLVPKNIKHVVAQSCGQNGLPGCLPMCLDFPTRDALLSGELNNNELHLPPTGIRLKNFSARETTLWERIIGVFNK